jgi:hypothetical protein
MSDPNFNDVILLLKFDGEADGSTTFTDLSNQEQTVVQSIFGGEIDTAISASGSGSLLVNATNKGLLIGGDGDVVNDLGTGDFTIEFFYNSASEPGSYSWLICNGTSMTARIV